MVYRSPLADIPIPAIDIYSFVFSAQNPYTRDKPIPDTKRVLIDGPTGSTLTYGEVRKRIQRFGVGLKEKLGWKKGDVMGIFAPNSIEYNTVVLGTLAALGTVTTANPAYTASELAHQLRNSGARALVTTEQLAPIALQAAAQVNVPESAIYVFDRHNRLPSYETLFSVTTLLEPPTLGSIDPDKDLAFLCYSSGTTGLPKGVMLTHRNIVACAMQIMAFDGSNYHPDSDTWMAFLPFYHIYGLTKLLIFSLLIGMPLVVMPHFDLPQFLSHIQTYKVTMVHLVPPVALHLAKNPIVSNYDLSSLRLLYSGAAPLSKEVIEQVWDRIHVGVRQGYGMTETSPTTHMLPWHEWRVYGSIGPLVPNVTAKLVDTETGEEVGPGKEGELCVKGPSVMPGYLNNPEANRNAIDQDGFFHTGDVAKVDERGYFYIVDRIKELIKYKGFQVPPAELESLLISHPSVSDACVVPVYSSEQATELPKAYIVLSHEAQKWTDEAEKRKVQQEIAKFVSERVARHKWLRGGVKIVEEIPKSASGKILRRVVRGWAEAEEKSKSAKASL